MRILIAEDEAVSRFSLEAMLLEWGHEVVVTGSGDEALAILQRDDSPPVAILDWLMPGMDGVEVCRKVREHRKRNRPYLILLTIKDRKEDIVEGLRAGASDYVSKPFHREELRARVDVGASMIGMREELAGRVRELQEALAHVKTLQGILPICTYCKKIRSDQDYWHQLESYLITHADVQVSHGVCPECHEKYVQPQVDAIAQMVSEEKGQIDHAREESDSGLKRAPATTDARANDPKIDGA